MLCQRRWTQLLDLNLPPVDLHVYAQVTSCLEKYTRRRPMYDVKAKFWSTLCAAAEAPLAPGLKLRISNYLSILGIDIKSNFKGLRSFSLDIF